jgi:hypothetical protein
MANSPLLLLFSSGDDFWGRPVAATEGPSALDFLAEHFTILGTDFQWWMPMTLGSVAIYLAWLWCTGGLFEGSHGERVPLPKHASARIPADISAAFGEAVILLIQWQGGADEPTATLDGEPVLIGLVFELIIGRKYSGQMPSSMAELLLAYAREEPRRRVQADALRLAPTYEVGARCLLRWVSEKKSESRASWPASSIQSISLKPDLTNLWPRHKSPRCTRR